MDPLANAFFVLLYTALGCWWILRGAFWDRSRLQRPVLLTAFLLKVLAGLAYGLVYFGFYQTGDAVHYFQDSRVIFSALPERPDHYLQLTFGYSPSGEVPESLRYLYDDMRLSWRTQEYLSVRINSLLNLLSFGHYYGNTTLLALLALMGLVMLHEAWSEAFPRHAGVLALAIFFLPSTLFWCSAVHKDAVTLFSLGAVLYALRRLAGEARLRHALLLSLGLFLLWNARSYLVMLMMPGLVLYVVCLRNPGRNLWRFAVLHALLLAGLVAVHTWLPEVDLLGKLAFEQEFLLGLQGNTHLPMRPIGDSLGSLLANLPMALDHVWIKPFSHPPGHVLQWVSAVAGLGQLLMVLLLLTGWRLRRNYHPLLGFSLWFSLSVLVVVGLTVPALGAIVRYKSAVMPLVFSCLLVVNHPGRWPAWLPSPKHFIKSD